RGRKRLAEARHGHDRNVAPILRLQKLEASRQQASDRDHMNPGLRGRYRVQSPNSRVDTSTIGNVMRMPCSTAMLRAWSLAPGRNADTCAAPLAAARSSAVLNAAPTARGCGTARGPTWPGA